MEGEINNLIKVWLAVIASLCYCYTIGKIIPKGINRLLSILPIVSLFFVLPLNLVSIHLGGATAASIFWLANSKLLLFAFDKGPLSSNPSLSLGHFLTIGCLPIMIQQNPLPKSVEKPLNKGNPCQNAHKKGHPSLKTTKRALKSPLNYTLKCVLLVTLVRIHDYSDYFHPAVNVALYFFHVYLFWEIVPGMVASLSQSLLGMELEPPFDEPYFSTSLQDFWGRRWNIIISSILRQTVYDPILHLCKRLMGRKWAPVPATMGAFAVSGLMHEFLFYYAGRTKPTWEVTCFFLLQGSCLIVEVALKKKLNGRCRLPWLISTLLTFGFLLVTGFWLFFPPLLRCKVDVRVYEECATLNAFVKEIFQGKDNSADRISINALI